MHNKICTGPLPNKLQGLSKLEKVLISKGFFSKKVSSMHGYICQFTKVKRNICNIPVENENLCNTLPRVVDSNGSIAVKFKCKMKYQGNIYF